MLPAFSRTPRCGRRTRGRCRPSPTCRAEAGPPSSCAAMPSTGRSRSRTLRSAFRPRPGGRSLGARARMCRSNRVLRACASASHGATSTAASPGRKEWLLIEWPKGEKEPTKYWLSSLPDDIGFARLVDLAKLRWRIERDYQELKQEIGLGHFEGRGWRGFHHHATLCIAAYGFLISERETIPPSAPRSPARFQAPRLPTDYRPRGSAAQDRASHPKLDRDHAAKTGQQPSSGACPDVHAAHGRSNQSQRRGIYDTVRLERDGIQVDSAHPPLSVVPAKALVDSHIFEGLPR